MTSVAFEFSLRQKVRIKEINRPGIITGLISEDGGLTYRVAYWDSGERKTTWLFGFEIEAA